MTFDIDWYIAGDLRTCHKMKHSQHALRGCVLVFSVYVSCLCVHVHVLLCSQSAYHNKNNDFGPALTEVV